MKRGSKFATGFVCAGVLAGCTLGPAETAHHLSAAPPAVHNHALAGAQPPGAGMDLNVFGYVIPTSRTGRGLCSATLIGRRSLITTAHCLDNFDAAEDFSPFATNGPNIQLAANTEKWKIVKRRQHPQWNGKTTAATRSAVHDVAMLLLESAFNDTAIRVVPKLWNHEGTRVLAAQQPARVLGYGLNDTDVRSPVPGTHMGVKLTATFFIHDVQPTHLVFAANKPATGASSNNALCMGDSGGPAFQTFADGEERLIATNANVIQFSSPNQQCGLFINSARVDSTTVKDFVNSWLMENNELPSCAYEGHCVANCQPVDLDCVCQPDGRCTKACTDIAKDPDCVDCTANGVCAQEGVCPMPDTDCVALGQPCSDAKACTHRLCITDAQHSRAYCSKPCSDMKGCDEGYRCNTDGQCILIQLRQEVSRGASCTPDETWCPEGTVCTGSTRDEARCQRPCGTDDVCPAGSRCVAGFDAQRYCRIPPPIPLYKASFTAQGGCSQGTGGISVLGLWALVYRLRRAFRRAASQGKA